MLSLHVTVLYTVTDPSSLPLRTCNTLAYICTQFEFHHKTIISLTGGVVVSSLQFQLMSELNATPPTFTLTCTSTGGPATTVSWRRDGVVITPNATYQQTKSLVDPVRGTYQTVLTIDPSVSPNDIVGTYNCTVENTRGRSSRIVVIGELIKEYRFACCCYLKRTILIIYNYPHYIDKAHTFTFRSIFLIMVHHFQCRNA